MFIRMLNCAGNSRSTSTSGATSGCCAEEWNTDEGISERMKSSKFELIVAERGGRYAEFQILQGQRYNGIQGRILSISSLIV